MEYKINDKVLAKVVNDAFAPEEGYSRYFITIRADSIETVIAIDAISKGYLKLLSEIIIEKQYPTGKLYCIEKQGSTTKYYQK